jgi:Ni,Fe-hydrogenase III small subunit
MDERTMSAVRVFHLDTGGCGACAVELWSTVEVTRDLDWAPGPAQADVVALTGSLLPAMRDAVIGLYREYWEDRVPIVVVGRCAIDGYPYGRGGIASVSEIRTQGRVEACPPMPQIIVYALLNAVEPLEGAGR